MPSTVVLYDLLTGAETGGTWTRISASGPTAPVLYNGSIDFAGVDADAYIYEYEVGDSTAEVTINWGGDAPDRYNDECATSAGISAGNNPPFEYIYDDDSRAICGIQKISTMSLAPAPSSWNQGSYSGDLWYVFLANGSVTNYMIQIEVSGEPFGSTGIYSPAIEIFTNLTTEGCVDIVTQANAASTIGQQTVVTFISIPGDEVVRVVKFRVSSVSGYEGEFRITITGICP